MSYRYQITILTPTYNRCQHIMVLYQSLCKQSVQCSQWLIIDDGSTDGTREVIEGLQDHQFLLEYHWKVNGGKHTALNHSHPYIKGEMVCIVDSDDWLLPQAVERMQARKEEYSHLSKVKILSFLRGSTPTHPLCKGFPCEPIVSNHIDFRVNAHRPGDCCEVLYSDVLKEFPFPEHPGEAFLGEGYLWNNSGYEYDTAYIPEIIYIGEYLEGGLTKSGRKLRIACPLGGMDNSNSFLLRKNGRRVSWKVLLKQAMLFVCYGKFAGLDKKSIIDRANDEIAVKRYYYLGITLYYVWRLRYR